MKPVGNSGISATDPAKNAPAAITVRKRCRRHQDARRMYRRMIRPSGGAGLSDAFMM